MDASRLAERNDMEVVRTVAWCRTVSGPVSPSSSSSSSSSVLGDSTRVSPEPGAILWASEPHARHAVLHAVARHLAAARVTPHQPQLVRRQSDFSIEHILRTAGPARELQVQVEEPHFEWLQCTRYRPPKLPRSRRRDGPAQRRLGRNPRIPFSSQQVGVLEERFRRSHYLSSADVADLSRQLQLSETRVKIWFQNRRARERRDGEGRGAREDRTPGSGPRPRPAAPSLLPRSAVSAFTTPPVTCGVIERL